MSSSSKLVSTNPSPPTNPDPHSLMDDLLKNIVPHSSSADDVWRDIIVTGNASDVMPDEMTLEDFLYKGSAEDIHQDDGTNDGDQAAAAAAAMTTLTTSQQRRKRRGGAVPMVVDDPPVVDKATQQKQRRMIKNRESAARSRERKQNHRVLYLNTKGPASEVIRAGLVREGGGTYYFLDASSKDLIQSVIYELLGTIEAYTAELESLVTKLEEENAQLLQEEAEQKKKRLKELMTNLIPVVESRRPRRELRRVNSSHW